MSNPINFWLNPQQEYEVRQDIYWPKQVDFGSDVGGTDSRLDSHGQPIQVAAPRQTCQVQVISQDESITDSNGYYKVAKIDAWCGPTTPSILVPMRLLTDEVLEEGDTCVAQFRSITTESPDPADDNFSLVEALVVSNKDQVFDNSNNASVYQSGPLSSQPIYAFTDTGIELGSDGGSPPQYGLRLNTGVISNAILTANVITSSMIADGAVGESEIANAAVTSIKIADGSIDAYKLADGICPLPCPPESGTYILQSVDGVIAWVGLA